MSHIKYAVICAAGMGTRLGLNMPKCLIDMGNKKLIEYQLDLLKEFPYVRIVVGFMEKEVMAFIKKLRSDIVFVRNPNFQKTNTLDSLRLGAADIPEPFVAMDADLIMPEKQFKGFCENFEGEAPLIAVTNKKSEGAVFVDFCPEKKQITSFSRLRETLYEWGNMACLNRSFLSNKKEYVYQLFENSLPLKGYLMDIYEVDTHADYQNALQHLNSLL